MLRRDWVVKRDWSDNGGEKELRNETLVIKTCWLVAVQGGRIFPLFALTFVVAARTCI